MSDALFILRTPLQACLAQRVILEENINHYDLIYLTQQDSEEDKYYFSSLSSGAEFSRYAFFPEMRIDIFNHLGFMSKLNDCFKDFGRKYIVIGSIDAPVVSAISAMQRKSALITIDDGTANINSCSLYHDHTRSWRYRTYARLLGAEPIFELKKKIVRHYSIFEGVDNIVDPARMRYIKSLFPSVNSQKNEVVKYFIGQPIDRHLRNEAAGAIRKILNDYKIDLYVRHPREADPLNFSTKFLEKEGQIAEHAILRHAAGRQVEIYSGFSTATLNLAPFVRSANIFLFPSDEGSGKNEICRLADITGCIVHQL